jgi:hypothetical protein
MFRFLKKISYAKDDIFVVGSLPLHNYVSRKSIEYAFLRALSAGRKLIILTGPTKCGKTVMVKTLLARKNYIWCNCGSFSTEDEFWNYILNKYEGFNSTSYSSSEEKEIQVHSKVEPTINSFLKFFGFGFDYNKKKNRTIQVSRNIPAKTEAIELITKYRFPIIFDDFHYLKSTISRPIVRVLKGFIFDEIPIVIIAIPHRNLDVIKIEPEIAGRIEQIKLPPWEEDELAKIGISGFNLLNVSVEEDIINRLTHEAIGSPHLMQEFCLNFCDIKQIDNTLKDKKHIRASELQFDSIFKASANDMGRYIYHEFHKNILLKRDKTLRISINGTKLSVFSALMQAFIDLKPGIEPLNFEILREKVISYFSSNKPSEHIILRTVDDFCKLALTDDLSTPIITFEKDENNLYITDPFFAYYLKWTTFHPA